MASGAGFRAASRFQQFAKSFGGAAQTAGRRAGSTGMGNVAESASSTSCKGTARRGAPANVGSSGRVPRASLFESEGSMHHSFASASRKPCATRSLYPRYAIVAASRLVSMLGVEGEHTALQQDDDGT
ncbi:hypothetical protein KFL_001380090 [Klebsormidium nitens]|uniref:Uncharacterized protein n=1 Tax=Klebsormidium nitens TaxID=105231 RepID=A0A1Y1I336_KLENI|nr:hypothetical protein KFL_001380090 [Klebsormidium nitens]|eukprot:GAQ83167.1 hypothetical protein KFL_001380090 [Klebsormidium nitens]